MLLGTSTITLIRQATGSYVDGVWTPGAETETAFLASVQPLAGDELEQLPEGDRAQRTLKLYTTTLLRTADVAGQTDADYVRIDGRRYVVRTVEDRTRFFLSHYKAVVVAAEDVDP